MPEWIVRLIVTLSCTLAGAYFVYRLGLRSYAKQKEYELLIERYLNNGVDPVVATVDHALNMFKQNYAQALRLLNKFKDTQSAALPLDEKEYKFEFLKYNPESLSVAPFYKVQSITGDDIFWESFQLLIAFVDRSYHFFQNQFRQAIEYYLETDKITKSLDDMCNDFYNDVWRHYKESERYHKILMELQNISLFLETKKLSFKELVELRSRPAMKDYVRRLRAEFADDLDRLNKLSVPADED